jgi:hypothetical protein
MDTKQRQDPHVIFDEMYERILNRTFCDRMKQLRFGLSRFTNEQIYNQNLPRFNSNEFKQNLDSEMESKMKQDWSTQRHVAVKFSEMFRQDNEYHDYCPGCWVYLVSFWLLIS